MTSILSGRQPEGAGEKYYSRKKGLSLEDGHPHNPWDFFSWLNTVSQSATLFILGASLAPDMLLLEI
jgi:hypothetical protein